ncbi:hypothetical protein RJ639_042234 [Escallonia herrerae]|uniref:Uncharacterized protein n=1 Tax=Escallonia herrerae TaxID=1293975 RepID=A0AA88WJ88_9ASTE|nr:hypothetical protein RJ639_042234 [Escallonia herrerae]
MYRLKLFIKFKTKQLGRLPVVHFAAGRLATLEDAALMMELGCDGVIVGSDVFKSGDPVRKGVQSCKPCTTLT